MLCKKSLIISVRADSQVIFEFLCSKDNILGDYKFLAADDKLLKIFLKGKVNWLSWGEKITIEIKSIADENTNIIISSEPSVPITLIDWGRNQQNVDKIAHYIYTAFPRAV